MQIEKEITSQEVESQENMRYTNQFLQALQIFSKDLLFTVDVKTMTLHHSFSSQRMDKIGTSIPDYMNTIVKEKIVHPDDAEIYVQKATEWFEDESLEYEVRFAIRDDSYEWYKVKSQKIYDEQGNFCEVLGTMINTQEQHNIHKEYSKQDQYFKAMQELSDDKLFHIDFKTKIFYHSDQNAIDFGVPESVPNFVETMIEKNIIYPDDIENFRKYNETLFKGQEIEFEIRSAVSLGVYEWFKFSTKFIRDADGNIVEIFGKIKNIQKQMDLEKKANFDKLTNVFSRETFEEKVNYELANTTENDCNAFIYIDIDDFKIINDKYGHQFGDFVLQKFTERILNCIKETDLIGRLGGDEFAVYLKNIGNSENALERANSFIECMNRPISNGNTSHKLGLSIGISVSPINGTELVMLYEFSDKATYISKKRGKNTATLYSIDM